MTNEVTIKDTHRGLWYEDGVLKQMLGPGRYKIPGPTSIFWKKPKVELVVVDVRERELIIKGQEILTADKVALRVSVIVQFRVTDPQAALHVVENYEERLYGDVQLAARRALASMTLGEILTNRNRLSENILRDVEESAATFGVSTIRADVKDLVFPGNRQEIVNQVLTAERKSRARLAGTRTEVQLIEAQTRFEAQQREAEANAHAQKLAAEAERNAFRRWRM
jgi:regulator of protease activity HflC (stomatin/prohibitin superfamily)